MKAIHPRSVAPALVLMLLACATPTLAQDPGAASAGGPGAAGAMDTHETDDQCRDNVRELRSIYKDAVNKNGASSFTARANRSDLDHAYADCCRAHASRWSWCDAGGNVRTDRQDQYPYDPGW